MREYTLRVSEEEKQSLNEVREEIFESDSVPYGEVIDKLVEEYYDG